jgi:hypothetical protein
MGLAVTAPVPYSVMPGLEHIYLEDSYVLDIVARSGWVTFVLDLVLTPGHPSYRPPQPSEQHCYRRAELAFEGVRTLLWRHSQLPPARDATGETDLGSIDSFVEVDGRYLLEGDWGSMEVQAAGPRIKLLESTESGPPSR